MTSVSKKDSKPKDGLQVGKMDGENHGKPYEQMDDLGGKKPIFGNTHICRYH